MVLGVAGGKIWHPRVQETMHGAVKSKQSGLYFGMFGMTTYSCQAWKRHLPHNRSLSGRCRRFTMSCQI